MIERVMRVVSAWGAPAKLAAGALVLTAGFFGGTAIGRASAPQTPTPPAGPAVWIDAPLEATLLPPGPATVVAHATSRDGIVGFEFRVDGTVQGPLLTDIVETSDTLAYVEIPWLPPGPGRYELQVRATDGDFGPPATVVVIVGEETVAPPPTTVPPTTTTVVATTTTARPTTTTVPPTTTTTVPPTTTTTVPPTTTTSSTSTTTTTTTVPPTTTTTVPPTTTTTAPPTTTTTAPPTTTTTTAPPTTTTTTAGDTEGPTFTRVDASVPIFYQGASSCGPTTVTITAAAEDPSGMASEATLRYTMVIPNSATLNDSASITGVSGSYAKTFDANWDFPSIPVPPRGFPPDGTLTFTWTVRDLVGNETTSTQGSATMRWCP